MSKKSNKKALESSTPVPGDKLTPEQKERFNQFVISLMGEVDFERMILKLRSKTLEKAFMGLTPRGRKMVTRLMLEAFEQCLSDAREVQDYLRSVATLDASKAGGDPSILALLSVQALYKDDDPDRQIVAEMEENLVLSILKEKRNLSESLTPEESAQRGFAALQERLKEEGLLS
jgi:hypothetical protein